MKKLVLVFVLSIITYTSFSQVEEFNGKKYLLPDILTSQGCMPFTGSDSIDLNIDQYAFWDFYSDNSDYDITIMHKCSMQTIH